MKAAVIHQFGDENVLQVQELPTPTPGEGEVLLRVRAAAVNPVDWKIRQGHLKDFLPMRFPLIPGWDVSGVVEAVGHAARRFAPGDAVYAYARRPTVQHGTYAEYLVLPESYLSAKPVNLTFEEAAGVPLAGLTAWQSLFDAARLQTGERVLVLGASGGVGSFAVQLARTRGAWVAAVASARNADYLRSLGAQLPLDYAQPKWTDTLLRALPGGVDVVFDCAGGDTFKACVPVLRPGGRVVSICEPQGAGLFAGQQARFQYVFVEPNSRQLDELRALLESGRLKVTVSATFPLDQVREAHRASQSGHTLGKIALRM